MAGREVAIAVVPTHLGEFVALVGPRGLARLGLPGEGMAPCRAWAGRWWPDGAIGGDHPLLAEVAGQLRAYLAGRRRDFSLPLDLRGTGFQVQVWDALTRIPFGQTRSYRWLAAAVGRPRAARAVGNANAANPVPIVVPCHRVVGSDGALVGYGGGLQLKRELLALEGIDFDSARPTGTFRR